MGAVVVEAIRWLMTDVGEREVGVANRVREYLNRYEETMALVLTNRQLKYCGKLSKPCKRKYRMKMGFQHIPQKKNENFYLEIGLNQLWEVNFSGDIKPVVIFFSY